MVDGSIRRHRLCRRESERWRRMGGVRSGGGGGRSVYVGLEMRS